MTVAGVADTHTAIWHLFGDARLSPAASAFIEQAANARHKVLLSSISLAETVYLVEKNRLSRAVYEELLKAVSDPEHVFAEAVLSVAIVQAMWRIPRSEVPDFPDRIIAAAALYLGVPVMSRDSRILASSLTTVW